MSSEGSPSRNPGVPGPGRPNFREAARLAVQEVDDRRRWLARPWEFAFDVIGREALDKAAKTGGGAIKPVEDFAPEQREYLSAFCDFSILGAMLKSARYGTKTWLMALGLATCAYCVPEFTATVNAGSGAQARILYRYFEVFATSPMFARCLKEQTTKTQTELRGGGWISVLTAGPASVTGPHPFMLVVDEACLIKEEIFELIMGQRSASGLIRISSTPYRRFHSFRDLFYAENKWRKFEWGRRRFLANGEWEPTFPWDSREVIEDAMANQDSSSTRIAIDGEFGSPSGTVFRLEDVEEARCEWWRGDAGVGSPGTRSDAGEIIPDPIYDWEAVASIRTGGDWGFEHPTVFTTTHRVTVPPESAKTLGLRNHELFYVVHVEGWQHKSEDFLYQRISDLLADERTSGDLYLDASHIFQNRTVARLAAEAHRSSHAIPFSRDKMAMVGWTRMLLEQHRVRIPRRFTELLEQLSNYEWEEGKEKPAKGNDDYVDSFMLSLWGHKLGAGGPPGAARISLRPRPSREG